MYIACILFGRRSIWNHRIGPDQVDCAIRFYQKERKKKPYKLKSDQSATMRSFFF